MKCSHGLKVYVLRRPQKLMKSSPSIWHLLHNVKSTVNTSSIFVASLDNMNFILLSDRGNREKMHVQYGLYFVRIGQKGYTLILKFMFSKKATKIDEIFTINLTLCSKCQRTVKILSIFASFLENTNFKLTELLHFLMN